MAAGIGGGDGEVLAVGRQLVVIDLQGTVGDETRRAGDVLGEGIEVHALELAVVCTCANTRRSPAMERWAMSAEGMVTGLRRAVGLAGTLVNAPK